MKKESFTADIKNGYALFWHGIFSNFYPCKILDKCGHKFISSEQMFMYGKALIFKDDEIAQLILKSNTPKEAKALGRKVKNFDSIVWNECKEQIMYDAVFEKFFQNEDLKQELISDKYNNICFVEASPYDRIWGIGYSIEDALIEPNVYRWGHNLLGITLNKVRDELREIKYNLNIKG